MNPNQQILLKEESLRWIFSILGALLVFYIAATIAQSIYHPDIEALKTTANQLLLEGEKVRPEPMESLLFWLGIFTIVPSLAIFYTLFSKTKLVNGLTKEPVYMGISILSIAAIAALIYFDFAAMNPYGPLSGQTPQNQRDAVSNTNFDFYFNGLFLGNYLLLYTAIIVPLISCLFFLGIKKHNWDNKKMFGITLAVCGYCLLGICLIAIIAMNTFNLPYTSENKYDFCAAYYSMTQVHAGAAMLTDGFTNTYGLYPHFLNIIFKLAGLSVFKFSLVMSLLIVLSFILNFYTLKKLVNNQVILFSGIITVIFFPYLNFRLLTIFDTIFSCYPIRYLIPSTIIYFSVVYLARRSAKLYWTTFIIAAFFTLWNPEIGMVCYLSWLFMNIYADYYLPEGGIAWKKIVVHIATAIGVLFAAFGFWKLFIYAVYGSWPDFSLLFGTIFIFSKVGFGLLPMSLVHPWNLMGLILVLGFLYPIVKWHKKEITKKSSIMLLISLIGVGYFIYFEGRSQNTNFAFSSGFSLILLTLLGDELWETARKTKLFLPNALFVVFLFLISFSAFEVVSGTEKMKELAYQEDDKRLQLEEQQQIENNADFILNNSREHEKIHVLTRRKNQALLFDGSKRVSAFNPGLIDIFLKKDIARLENILIDSSYSLFMEQVDRTYKFLDPSLAAIAATYEVKTTSPSMSLLTKRRIKIPANAFFNDPDKQAFHKKYTSDRAGTLQRIADAPGSVPVTLDPECSFEVLYYSQPQRYSPTIIVGNINKADSSGFIVGTMENGKKCFCVINSLVYLMPVPEMSWVYFAMNIFTDRIEVYRNGEPAFVQPLTQPFRRSPAKVRVGNMSLEGDITEYHIGAIAEIAIANKILDKDQIKNKWLSMQPLLSK